MPDQPEVTCPACDSTELFEETVDYTFPYRSGDDRVELTARVPVTLCACGEGMLDDRAEDIMHDAICDHLGMLKPKEIRELRTKKIAQSQEGFAELTGISRASLQRWESGTVIQNRAMDNLMRLTESEDAQMFLRRIAQGEDPAPTKEFTFPSMVKTDESFQLRPDRNRSTQKKLATG